MRRGTTLTEVLMSIVLMGIGCVTLATLFPIAILRTTRATQQTNATIHRFNAEAMIDLRRLVSDKNVPDASPNVSVRVIDPIGFYLLPAALRDQFGNDGTNPTGIERIATNNGTDIVPDPIPDLAAADAVCTSDDSFVDIVTSPVSASSATGATLTGSLDGVRAGHRALLFSATGKHAEVRTIAAPVGQDISWTEPLPSGFTVERARIQQHERIYTWLATARRLPGALETNVDIAVFFRRNFSPEDERVFSAPSGTAFDLNDPRRVRIDYSTSPFKPPLTVGSFVFDAENCRWYRISGVNDDASAKTAILTIDRPALEDSNSAILMRGIIDVYPIGTKPPPL